MAWDVLLYFYYLIFLCSSGLHYLLGGRGRQYRWHWDVGLVGFCMCRSLPLSWGGAFDPSP